MRVRLDRYEARHKQMQMRTLIGFVVGGGILFVGAFGLFIATLLMFAPSEADVQIGGPLWARRAGFLIGIFCGFAPSAIGGLMIWNGIRQRARYRRYGDLAALARQRGDVTAALAAQAFGVTPLDAEKLIVEASTLGMIEDAPSLVPPALAPTVASGGSTPPPRSGDAGSPLRPGVVVGGTYRIEEPLGSGGMGAVHAARHMRTGRRYAIKTILPHGARSDDAMRRFEREATAASALGHPNIIQVHDFNADGGSYYLVMDLLEGETLAQRLERDGTLPWPEAQRIALEICSALAAAHEHGLLHRDIKPSNVFLARTKGAPDRSVLVDFGLVKPLESGASGALTSTGAVVGTPMYMSPEQARGEALDVRSDVYSLGAVVFEAVTGAPPFRDRTLASVYARILNEPAPRPSQVAKRAVPPGVDDVLGRALAKARDARFADARAFSAALAAITEDSPTTERLVG
jgi:tRNA A-37 threonylcarbamoyl transferase component Bud32